MWRPSRRAGASIAALQGGGFELGDLLGGGGAEGLLAALGGGKTEGPLGAAGGLAGKLFK